MKRTLQRRLFQKNNAIDGLNIFVYNYKIAKRTEDAERRREGKKMEEFVKHDHLKLTKSGEGWTIVRFEYRATEVTIPSFIDGLPVTAIGKYAFAHLEDLESVFIPDTVKEIGVEAFSWCRNLKSVRMSENVEKIEKKAFYLCDKMRDFKMSKSIKSIGDVAFYGCTLSGLFFPEGLVEIGEDAFMSCKGFDELVIPDSVTKIGKGAFYACKFKSVTIGAGVTIIEKAMFYLCSSLEKVTIGKSVTKIEEEAFRSCKNLTNVEFLEKDGWGVLEDDGMKAIPPNLLLDSIFSANLLMKGQPLARIC